MAEIFKGLTYDFSGIKKFIVIKRILPHIAANKEFIDMLIAEAKIAVSLSHGNIAQVYDLGKVGNDYFIVMEYVDGKSLSQILRKCQQKGIPIPVEFCAYCISELCQGLDHMHRKKDEAGHELKIVHRDISPQNVIVSYSGNVKIVDFGVAKAAFKLGERENGILKGKFAYMSPEQAEGVEIDSRSDLFSTGIVFWEMLTGQRLFKKKSNTETVEAVKKMGVIPPSHFRADIPPELDRIVLKALERIPELRYASAHDMSLDLMKYLLKFYPFFKPSETSEFLNQIFGVDDDVTGNFHLEKTMKDDATLADHTRSFTQSSSLSTPPTAEENRRGEETQVVNPEEIDFRSIFNEISWEDESGGSKKTVSPPAVAVPEEPSSQAESLISNAEELSVTFALPFETKPVLSPPQSHTRRGVFIGIGLLVFLIFLFLFFRFR